MTPRFDGCSGCIGNVNDSRRRHGSRTREEWAEGAKTCFFCGLVDAILQDAKEKYGIDPSGGGRFAIAAGFREDIDRWYLCGHTTEYVSDDKITAQITFYNPISKVSSFSLPSSRDD